MYTNELVTDKPKNLDALFAALGISFEKEDLLEESIDTIIGLLDYIADAYGEGSYMYRELAPVEDKLKRVLKLVEEEYDEE
jgi:hypothetical protein